MTDASALPLHLDQEIRAAELREAAAPLAIARILLGVRPQHRARILRCITHAVAADDECPGMIERLAQHGHAAIKSGEE